MAFSKTLALALAVSVLASGCVFLDRGEKWPKLQMAQKQAAETPAPEKPSEPSPAPGTVSAADVTKMLASLSARMDLHAGDLSSIEAQIANQRGHYESALSTAQSGPAPAPANGQPADRWNVAEIELTRLSSDVARFGDLASSLATDAGRLAEAYAAAQTVEPAKESPKPVEGLASEGQPQPSLTARATQLIARAGRLLQQVRLQRAEAERYVDEQHRKLTELRPKAPEAPLPSLPKDRDAYIVFHLDRDDTGYEAALRNAIMQALQRNPDITFDVYTVAGNAQDDIKAEDRAEDVRSILRSMMVTDNHITMTNIRQAQPTPPEVRIYVR